MKMLWQNVIKDCQIECEKQIDKKNKDIAKLQDAIQKKEDEHSKKLKQIREKLKTTEKDIYMQIEEDYAVLLKSKDEQINEQTVQFMKMQEIITTMADRIESDRNNL